LFSDYEIVKALGEGGFGKVMLGIHRVTKKKVAMKFVDSSAYGDASTVNGIFNESATLANLKHPNIVEIINTISLPNNSTVFIMEYLEGGELKDLLLESHSLSEREAREIFI